MTIEMTLLLAVFAYFVVSAVLAWTIRAELRGSDVIGLVLCLFVLPILFLLVQVHNFACHMRRRRAVGRP